MTVSSFRFQRNKKIYLALKTVFGFVPNTKLHSRHPHDCQLGRVENDCSCYARGCRFASYLGCIGFDSNDYTFDVLTEGCTVCYQKYKTSRGFKQRGT